LNADTLFSQALEFAPSERDAFLTRVCGGDLALRAEIDELLQSHEAAGGFLRVDAEPPPAMEVEFARLKPEDAGERIGNYKLLERIGEGGFGIVWVAEQEKPVQRRVALKIIKVGMDTKEVIARFEQERQALAMMDHPNIAKVLDAGATPFGRPFFVMELVRGVKITEHCDQANLSTAERLQLFVSVCHAVQHAHQKGIIHRDLKPSNILVTLHDGVPVPKVIDFGVAKATQRQRLTDLTVYTHFEQMVGTPLYMSPEQAEMSGLDIDTRSDIYALGVLLYELLVGRTPFDPEALMKKGLDELRRVVREQEPQKPSTFVSTMAVDLRTNLAQRRRTDSAKLIGQIRGDLDWIVMKALEKDRTRRYETASELARDIDRHLKSQPVHARPPTRWYRFRRFARRNKIAFVAGSAVLGALLIGLAVSMWMFFQEKEARERALAAETKSRQIAQFLTDMLHAVGPSVALGRDTTLLRELLDKTAERVGKDLKDHPEVEAALRGILGEVYNDLADYEKAAAMHRVALTIQKQLHGNEHPEVAKSLGNLAVVARAQGKLAEAETMQREALALQRKLFGNEHRDVAESLNNLALVFSDQGKLADAEILQREVVAMGRKRVRNEHSEMSESLGNLAISLSNLAITVRAHRNLAEAETIQREALAIQRKLFGNNHPNVAASLSELANILGEQGKFADADNMEREALAMERKLFGNEHPNVANSLHNLAAMLARQHKLPEAETLLRDALAIQRKVFGEAHPDVAFSINTLANVLAEQSKPAEAEKLFREALAMRRKLLGNDHPDVLQSLNNLAVVLGEQHKWVEEETVRREALAMQKKLLGNENADVASSLHQLAVVLDEQGKLAEAETLFREALAMRRKLLGDNHPKVAISLDNLAMVLRERGDLAEAETMQREALAMKRKLFGNDDPKVAISLNDLAVVLHDQGKLADAETMQREALGIQRKVLGNEHPDVATSLNNLANALREERKPVEAEAMQREALAMQKKLFGHEHPDVASSLANLGIALTDQRKLAEAETMHREALAMRRKLLGDEHPDVANSLNALAVVLSEQGKLAEAETMDRDVLAMQRKLLGNEHPYVAGSLNNLAFVLARQGKLGEAETRFREALAMERKLFGDEHPFAVQFLNNLVSVLQKQGKDDEATELLRAEMTTIRSSTITDPAAFERLLQQYADSLYRQNQYGEAEPLYRELVDRRSARHGAEHEDALSAIASLARLLTDWAWAQRSHATEPGPTQSGDSSAVKRTPNERAREAERLLRNCLTVRLRGTKATPSRIGDTRSRLGAALLAVAVTDPALGGKARRAKFIEAESLLLDGNVALQQDPKTLTKYKRDSLDRLVRLYEAWGKTDKVAEWQQKLADFDKAEATKENAANAASPTP
jgi:serine/threonine protein kinase/tetratricopeptide (TPR) repeat protein